MEAKKKGGTGGYEQLIVACLPVAICLYAHYRGWRYGEIADLHSQQIYYRSKPLRLSSKKCLQYEVSGKHSIRLEKARCMAVVCCQKLRKAGKGRVSDCPGVRGPQEGRKPASWRKIWHRSCGLHPAYRNLWRDEEVSIVIGGGVVCVIMKAPRRRLRRGALFFATI